MVNKDFICSLLVLSSFCRSAAFRLYAAAGAINKNAGAEGCGDVELVSLHGFETDNEQHQQLKPRHNYHHQQQQRHELNDCCSYSHVWPLMTDAVNQADRLVSTTAQRRYLAFDLHSDDHNERREHIYRSVNSALKQTHFIQTLNVSNSLTISIIGSGTDPLSLLILLFFLSPCLVKQPCSKSLKLRCFKSDRDEIWQ